jgi:hypothetical protein
MRDRTAADGAYRANFDGTRTAIDLMLSLFDQFGVGATWATVGLLFARTRHEREELDPVLRPEYSAPELSPYAELTGAGEEDDPLHYAGSVIRRIAGVPRQEIGTHTYSHYYCLEPGQTAATFRADLRSAVAAASRYGIRLESMVFPRNQHNPDYDAVILEHGIICYRGGPPSKLHAGVVSARETLIRRAGRFLDSHVNLTGQATTAWADVCAPNGLCNVAASMFLRPATPGRAAPAAALRLRRIRAAMNEAALAGRIFHLWWHPHNFGAHPELNALMLRSILEHYRTLADRHGMESLTMAGAARAALAAQAGRSA